MQDKDYDGFFEEKKEGQKPEESLMELIDNYDSPTPVEMEVGSKVEGTVLNVGKEYVFIDVGGKNEAMMSVGELTGTDGAVSVKQGDRLEAYVVSTDNSEVMLSRSLKGGRNARNSDLVEAMKNGIPVQGKVTGVNKGGFNVNIMGHRAFCPRSHIDLKYVEDPNAYLSKSFSFMISRVTEGGRNVVVSRLPLLEQELVKRVDEFTESISEKRVYTGTITRITDFGLFVDLGGVEGLVHISEVSWERAQNLSQTYSPGQMVDCVVLKVEKKPSLRDSRISLSIKHVHDDPWKSIGGTLHIGDSVEGTITRCTNFGAFVQLVPGIEGLIHVSEMRWGERVKHPSDVVSEGQKVLVSILGIDEQKRSVSCSLKDIAEDPWNGILDRFPVGSTTTGIIAGKTRYGYFVNITEGVTGLLVYNNIAPDMKDRLKEGESIEVGIGSVDTERRRISLTHGIETSRQEQVEAKAYLEKQKKKEGSSSEFAEKLKAALRKNN